MRSTFFVLLHLDFQRSATDYKSVDSVESAEEFRQHSDKTLLTLSRSLGRSPILIFILARLPMALHSSNFHLHSHCVSPYQYLDGSNSIYSVCAQPSVLSPCTMAPTEAHRHYFYCIVLNSSLAYTRGLWCSTEKFAKHPCCHNQCYGPASRQNSSVQLIDSCPCSSALQVPEAFRLRLPLRQEKLIATN